MSKRHYTAMSKDDISASKAIVRVFVEPVAEYVVEGQPQRLAQILLVAVKRAQIQKAKCTGGKGNAVSSLSVVC